MKAVGPFDLGNKFKIHSIENPVSNVGTAIMAAHPANFFDTSPPYPLISFIKVIFFVSNPAFDKKIMAHSLVPH